MPNEMGYTNNDMKQLMETYTRWADEAWIDPNKRIQLKNLAKNDEHHRFKEMKNFVSNLIETNCEWGAMKS